MAKDPNIPHNPDGPPNPQESAQIGAGLQESRLNTEFIDFLKKYSNTALYVVLAVVLVWVGWGYIKKQQVQALDQALLDYESARTSSAQTLEDVATDNQGKGAVPTLATLASAEAQIRQAVRGLKDESATFNLVQRPTDQDLLSDSEKSDLLNKAIEKLQSVQRETDKTSTRPLWMRAKWHQATAQLNLGDYESAQSTLESLQEVAEKEDYATMAEATALRIERLPTYRDAAALPTAAQAGVTLPSPPPAGPQPSEQVETVTPQAETPGVFTPAEFDDLIQQAQEEQERQQQQEEDQGTVPSETEEILETGE